MNLAGVLGTRCEPLAIPVDHDQLVVVGEPLPDRLQVVVEQSDRLVATIRLERTLDVLAYKGGAREDPNVVEAILDPEVESRGGLGTRALQLFVDSVRQGSTVLDVLGPSHRQGWDQRGQQGEAHDPALDALKPEQLGDATDNGPADAWLLLGHTQKICLAGAHCTRLFGASVVVFRDGSHEHLDTDGADGFHDEARGQMNTRTPIPVVEVINSTSRSGLRCTRPACSATAHSVRTK